MTPKSPNIIKVNLTHSYLPVLSLFSLQLCSGTQCCVWVVRLSGSWYCLCSRCYLERLMSVCVTCVWVCLLSVTDYVAHFCSSNWHNNTFPCGNFPHTSFPAAVLFPQLTLCVCDRLQKHINVPGTYLSAKVCHYAECCLLIVSSCFLWFHFCAHSQTRQSYFSHNKSDCQIPFWASPQTTEWFRVVCSFSWE